MPPWLAHGATAAGAPRELLDLEDLLSLGSTLHLRVVDLLNSSLLSNYLIHLLFRDESSLVPESILSKILPAQIADVLAIRPL